MQDNRIDLEDEESLLNQDLSELDTGTLEHLRASGNDEADKAANRGRGLHAAPAPGAMAHCLMDFEDALTTCKLAARALARWPTALPRVAISEQHLAAQRAATAARRRKRAEARQAAARLRVEHLNSHDWAHWGGMLRCNVCLISKSRGGRQACPGEPTQLWSKAAEASRLGHDIWCGELVRIRGQDPSIPCLVCRGCGGWAQTGQAKAAQGKLGRPCVPDLQAIFSGGFGRARRGLHPQAGSRYADVRLADLFHLPADALQEWHSRAPPPGSS